MKLLFAALLAALASFFWGYISWMVMSWHEVSMHDFKDEQAVTQVIRENATEGRGIYALPFQYKPLDITSPEEAEEMQAKYEKAMKEGPFMFAIVRPGKNEISMKQNLIRSFVRSFIAAILLGALMTQLTMSYPGKLAFAATIGALIGLGADVPDWIWFELPTRDLIVNMADHFIEWTIMGCVMALFLGRELNVRNDH